MRTVYKFCPHIRGIGQESVILSLITGGRKYEKSVAITYSDASAPHVGLEPTTTRLTAECSAIELLRNIDCWRNIPASPTLFWNPATSYSPGPLPAKYHQRSEA